MRKEDLKFAGLEPKLELYKAKTSVDYRLQRRCAFGHMIQTGMPFRVLFFRERGSTWKGKRVYLICAQHYHRPRGVISA